MAKDFSSEATDLRGRRSENNDNTGSSSCVVWPTYRSSIMYSGLWVKQAMSDAPEMSTMTGMRRCVQLLGHGVGRASARVPETHLQSV